MPQPPPEEVPKVVVPVRASKLHPTAQAVKHALVKGPGDAVGVVSVLGSSGKVVRVSERWKSRALRILHGLVTALEAEGLPTKLRVLERPGWERHDRYHLEVLVENQPVPVLLKEKIEFVPQEGAYSGLDNPKAHRPTGRLTLWVAFPAGSRGNSWSDREGLQLEEQLGEAILSVKKAAPLWVEHEKRMAEQRKVWDEEWRRIREQERRQQHLESLSKDLATMSAQWRRAEDLRSFIAALEQKVAPAARDQVFNDWLAWARSQVAELDPLARPEQVAKRLEPDPERQAEQQGERQRMLGRLRKRRACWLHPTLPKLCLNWGALRWSAVVSGSMPDCCFCLEPQAKQSFLRNLRLPPCSPCKGDALPLSYPPGPAGCAA